jgi:hypothetical protein
MNVVETKEKAMGEYFQGLLSNVLKMGLKKLSSRERFKICCTIVEL